jgi:hypothetical protein
MKPRMGVKRAAVGDLCVNWGGAWRGPLSGCDLAANPAVQRCDDRVGARGQHRVLRVFVHRQVCVLVFVAHGVEDDAFALFAGEEFSVLDALFVFAGFVAAALGESYVW